MRIFLLLLLLQSSSTPLTPATSPSGPPAIVVQAVDQDYLPIPGATVTVSAVANKSHSVSARTGDNGSAEFFVPAEADYLVEIKMQNFKVARLKHLHISKPSTAQHTAYVQLVMKFSDITVTVD
jgi:Carboxypeptidase regulatory-like domain